jgi:hypothetical protein
MVYGIADTKVLTAGLDLRNAILNNVIMGRSLPCTNCALGLTLLALALAALLADSLVTLELNAFGGFGATHVFLPSSILFAIIHACRCQNAFSISEKRLSTALSIIRVSLASAFFMFFPP